MNFIDKDTEAMLMVLSGKAQTIDEKNIALVKSKGKTVVVYAASSPGEAVRSLLADPGEFDRVFASVISLVDSLQLERDRGRNQLTINAQKSNFYKLYKAHLQVSTGGVEKVIAEIEQAEKAKFVAEHRKADIAKEKARIAQEEKRRLEEEFKEESADRKKRFEEFMSMEKERIAKANAEKAEAARKKSKAAQELEEELKKLDASG